MSNPITMAMVALALIPLAGCSSPPSQPESVGNPTAADGSAPVFTAEEKAAMTQEEKLRVYNETAADRDRVVCRRERPVGSHMPRTICRTVAEIEAEREAAQETIRQDRVGRSAVPSSQ